MLKGLDQFRKQFQPFLDLFVGPKMAPLPECLGETVLAASFAPRHFVMFHAAELPRFGSYGSYQCVVLENSAPKFCNRNAQAQAKRGGMAVVHGCFRGTKTTVFQHRDSQYCFGLLRQAKCMHDIISGVQNNILHV